MTTTTTLLRPCPRCRGQVETCDCPDPWHIALTPADGGMIEVYGYATRLEDARQHVDVVVMAATLATLPDAVRVEFPDCTGSMGEAGAGVVRELMWSCLSDLLSAGGDPDEWWYMSTVGTTLAGPGGDPSVPRIATPEGRGYVRRLLHMIEVGLALEPQLRAYEDMIRQATGNGEGCLQCQRGDTNMPTPNLYTRGVEQGRALCNWHHHRAGRYEDGDLGRWQAAEARVLR